MTIMLWDQQLRGAAVFPLKYVLAENPCRVDLPLEYGGRVVGRLCGYIRCCG